MSRKIIIFALLGALLIGLAVGASAQCVISGVVKDSAGNLVKGARVFWNDVPGAATDPVGGNITTTGDDGSYQITITPGTWYVGAWREFNTSNEAKVTIADGENKTADLQLRAVGINLVQPDADALGGHWSLWTATTDPGNRNNLYQAFNGNPYDLDAYSASPDAGWPQQVTVNIDNNQNIARSVNGVTIIWGWARPTNYSVEVSTNGSAWTQVYTMSGREAGVGHPTMGGTYISTINFTARPVLYVRLNVNEVNWVGSFDIKEFMVHSATQPMGMLCGTVRDASTGNPLKFALCTIGNQKLLTDESGSFGTYFMTANAIANNMTPTLVTVDALGYTNKDQLVIPAGLSAPLDCDLTPNNEVSAVPNWNMEELDGSGNLVGWTANSDNQTATISVSTENHTPGIEGGHSAQLDRPSTRNWDYTWIKQKFAATPGYYNFWAHRQQVSGWDWAQGEEYNFYANDTDEYPYYWGGKITGDNHGDWSNVGQALVDDNGWKRYTAVAMPYRINVPAEAAYMEVVFGELTGSYSSSDPDPDAVCFRLDDVILEPVVPSVGDLTGRVVDSNGQPVKWAYVCYGQTPNALMDGSITKWAQTDEDGYYTASALPLGLYYVAAFKEGYRPSADVTATVASTAGSVASTITLETAKDNIVLGRDDMLYSSATMDDSSISYAVDGIASTVWNAKPNWGYGNGYNYPEEPYVGEDFGPAQYLIAAFDGKSDISDVVLYRDQTGSEVDPMYQDYDLQVMYAGDPTNNDSWDNPVNPADVVTFYSKNRAHFGAQISPSQSFSAMPVDFKQVLGLRVHFRWAHWIRKHGFMGELEIHGKGKYEGAKTIGELKLKDLNTPVAISGKVVTGLCFSDGGSNYGIPANTAYVEESDRSNGIRLDVTGQDLSLIGQFSVISVQGTLKETTGHEKYIECDKIRWMSDNAPMTPLGMNNRFAATKMAQGLYVKVWGAISAKIGEDGDRKIYTLDDGSGSPMKLYYYGFGAPSAGTLVRVSGIVSTDGTETVIYATDTQIDY